MKCPLLLSMSYVRAISKLDLKADCLREECAWWDKIGKSCIIQTAGAFIGTICDILSEVQVHMPHEEQFRK